jgi:hypothetical protein
MKLLKFTNSIAENRLVYADKKGGGPDSISSKELDSTSKKQLNEIEDSALTPHGKSIAALYRSGKIDGQTLKEIRDLINDPNKMQNKHYQEFIKALSLGRFPSRSANSLHFLKAIGKKGQAADRAREIVKDLSEDSSGPLTARREKVLLKELTSLQEKDIIDETTKGTSSSASITLQTADIQGRAKASSETAKSNWALERAPAELVEKLDRIEYAQFQITKKSKLVWQEFKKENSQPEKNEAKIKKLQDQLTKLDQEFDALAKELSEPKKKWIEYLSRSVSRYRALDKFFTQSGLDAKSTAKIRMWMLGLMSKGKSTSSLKMMGVKVDPKTGKASREEETIEIVGISFDTDKADKEPESPGQLNIHYKDKTGEVSEASYKVFLNMINTYEAYTEVDSLSELNELIAPETNYKDLAIGDAFEVEMTTGLDEEGNPVTSHVSFKIESIDEEGKHIVVDENLKTMPRELLSNSVHPSLYFDRYKKEFNFGEFARFLRQNKFVRGITKDETAQVLGSLQARQEAEIKELQVGSSQEASERIAKLTHSTADTLTVPSKESRTEVVFLDQNNKKRFGVLKQNPDNNTFSLDVGGLAEDASIQNSLAEMANVIPLSLAAGHTARTKLSEEESDYYQNIPPHKLVEMVENGQIANLPTETNSAGQRKWSVDPDAQNAVAAMERSDKGAGSDAFATDNNEGMPASDDMPEDSQSQMPQGQGPGPGQESQEGAEAPKAKKSTGYEEALPYDDIYKVGGMSRKEANFARKIWAETRFLSVSDFWEMGKSMWEYYDRRWQRRQKERYSSIGEELPFFAPEMRRINQSAENEEVDQFKSTFEQKGIFEIQGRLNKTRNRDEMKASYIVLAEKGQIRWDDIDMWKNLNRFVDSSVAIPIPSNGDPNTKISTTDDRTGFDFLKEAIDSLWGEGTYSDWFQRNKGSYASNLKNFYEEGKELEGVQGGHGRRLSELLRQHKMGEYVDPHEYEGLIMHAIEYGKSSMQNKIYFLVEGIAAFNGDGRTILSFERMAHVNSEMLVKFPLLEYLCASVPRPDGKGTHRWTIDDYKQWVRWFDEGNSMNCSSTPSVDRFMWKYVIPSEPTKNRINKAFRNGEQIDHDDMFAYLPPASEQVITDATRATTGSKKFFTVEGYANAFPGFSEYFRSLSEAGNGTKLLQAIKSYFRYESIMSGRFEKERWNDYQRLDQDTMRRQTIVSTTPPIAFTTQLNAVIDRVVAAYDDPELTEIYALSKTETGDIQVDKNEMEKQKKVNAALGKIGDVFDRVFRADGGQKMVSIIAAANLEGMPYGMSDAEKDSRKAAFSDEYNEL